MPDGPAPPEPRAPRPRRRRLRRFVVRPIAWLGTAAILLLAIVPFAVRHPAVAERLRQRLEVEATRLLEREVTIEHLRLSLLPPAIDLGRLRLAGPTAESAPTFAAQGARLDIDLLALLGQDLRFERLELDEPRFVLELGPDGDSLPRPHLGDGGGSGWRVILDWVEITDGRVVIDESSIPLDLIARGVAVDATGTGGTDLLGQLAAQSVWLEVAGLDPVELELEAAIALGSGELRLREARVRGEGLDLLASGSIGWEERTVVALEVEGEVDERFVRGIGVVGDELEGAAEVSGTFEWNGASWGARAEVGIGAAWIAGVEVRDAAARVALDRSRLVIDIDSAEVFDGSLRGRVALDPALDWRVMADLEAQGLSLAAITGFLSVPLEGLDATLSGPVEVAFEPRRWAEGVGRARLQSTAGEGRLGRLDGRVDVAWGGGGLDLAWALRSPLHQVEGGGRIELPEAHGNLDLVTSTSSLGRLLEALPWQVDANWWPESGHGRIAASIELARAGAAVELAVDLSEVAAPAWHADTVAGVISIDGEGVDRLRLEASLGDAALLVVGRVPFGADPLSLTFDAAGWPASELRVWLPHEPPIDGLVTGSLELRGPPSALEGVVAAQVDELSWGELGPLGELSLALAFDPTEVRIDRAELLAAAGCLEVNGTIVLAVAPALSGGELDLSVRAAAIDLGEEPFVGWIGRRVPVVVGLEGQLTGDLTSPSVEAVVTTRGDEAQHRLLASWNDGRLAVDGSLPGGVGLRGGGLLDPSSADLNIAVEVADLAALARLLELPTSGAQGRARGELALRFGPRQPTHLRLTVPELVVVRAGRQVEAIEPIELVLEGSRLTVESAYFGTPDGSSDVFVGGSVEIGSGALDLVVQAGVELALLEDLLALPLEMRGRAELLTRVRGTLDQPAWRGQGAVRDARLMTPSLPSPLSDVEAEVLLDPGLVILDRATSTFAGGTVRVQGRAELDARTPSFRFQAVGRDLTLRWPPGFQFEGNSELVWSGTSLESSAITGRIDLVRGWYRRDIETDPLRLVRSALQHQRVDVASADASLAGVQLSIAVVAPATLRVRNNLARLEASADLVIRGNLARPAVFGRIQSEPGGTFEYNGSTYEIERAVVTFVDPVRINPLLDVVATSKVGSYAVSLTAAGTLDRLELSFASDPPLANLEVLTLVAGGEGAAERLGAFESGGVQTSLRTQAESLLLGQAAALIEKRVGTLFGLDTIQIEPLGSSGDAVSSARVTVGRQLSSRLRATYSWDPSTTEQQRLRVEWQADEGWILVFTQNGDGTFSVDSRWERRF